MLLISTILLSLSSVSYAYQINRIPTSLTNKHNNRVATTAIYQRPPSYEPPPYDDDYYYDEYDELNDISRDPFDYFDDYEDVDLPPPLGYNQNYEPPPQPNLYRPQQNDGNFEFDMTPSNQNRVPNNSRTIQRGNSGSGTISIKEQQTAYRSTKYNRSTSWQSKQNYRLDQTPFGSSPNSYPPSSNNLQTNSNSNRQDFQRTSGSPSTWSQQLYDSQNNFNPSTSSLPTQQQQLQSSRYGKLPGQSPLLNTRSSYERGGDLVPNGTPSGGFNRDGILSPSNNNLYPSNNNNPNNPYSLNSPQRQQQQQRRGGLASILTGAQTIGESYTDNFRRGPGSEDFRQSTRQKRRGSGINTHGIVGGGRPSRDIGIGQGMRDELFDPRDEFDRDDYEFGRDDYGYESPFDREWDDDKFNDIIERRERWDSIADNRRQEVGRVGREGNSYYYEPQPGDYTYGRGGRRSDERSRRDTEDLLGRGNDDIRGREEEYEYDSGDFAWQRRRRRREQDELPPPQQQENNREVAFNRSRPTSIGNIANTIPRRPNPTIDVTAPFNNNNSRRPDSIGKKAWSDSSPSPSSKKQSPTFTYQNEKNDYRRRGEQQSPQYGREVAFGRNEATTTKYGGNSYSQDRRRSSLETKSSTFGQLQSPPPRPTERINPQQQQQNQQQQQRNRAPPPPQQQQYDQGGMQRPVEQPPNTSRWSNQPVQRPVEPQQTRRPQRNTKQLKSTQKPQRYSNQGPLRNEFKKKEKNPFDFVDDIIKNGVNVLDQIRDVRGDTTTTSSNSKNKNSRMNKKRKSKSSSSLEEDRITKVLLADARSYIISDTSLRNILGDSISIGEVYTRSYSSTMVNGTNRSRCQISFEVNGSRGSGKGTLIANQEDIIKLDVDIGNDVIEINVRRPQGFNVRDIGR